MTNILELINLIKLSQKRFNSKEDYKKMQFAQARLVYKDISKILNLSKESFVIDFGCGNGGYTEFFATKFKKVLGVDFTISQKNKIKNIIYKKGDLLTFKSKNKADFIFCSSVIEHIENADKLIKNIYNNLNPGGYIYLSFPPFYSLGGGHSIKPFHYLPEKLAINLAKRAKIFKISSSVNSYKNLFGNHGLHKRTISKVKNLLIRNNCEIITYKTRHIHINTARIPLLKDLLTWHVEFYCRKKIK